MKLIIDIPEKTISHIRSDYGHGCKAIFDEDRDKIVDAIYHGIPLDDVKAEIFRQSKQNNENFSCDWNEGFNDGMFHTLTIIKECFKHISGKAESEGAND